jgi:hypothetical protein
LEKNNESNWRCHTEKSLLKRYSSDGQIFIWDYIHQARYKIKPIIDVKKVTSAYKGNERCTIQAYI